MDAAVYTKMNELETNHWWFAARREYIEALIQRYVPGAVDSVFCEVGAGTGGNLKLLGRYAQIDAIEYEEDAVATIKGKSLPNVRRVASGYLPDGIPFEGTYNAVFALDVVEHVERDDEAVMTLASMLSPEGKLVLTVPAYQWLWSGHDTANHHFRRYNKHQVVALLERAGLEIEFSSYFNTVLFPLKLMQHLKTKLAPPVEDHWEVELPSPSLNSALRWIFSQERHVAGRLAMPFGLSIAVVASKHGIES